MPGHTNLGNGLGQGIAGFVGKPHFLFGRETSADGLQLRQDRLIRHHLDFKLGLQGGIELQMLPHSRVCHAVTIDKQTAGKDREGAHECRSDGKGGLQGNPAVLVTFSGEKRLLLIKSSTSGHLTSKHFAPHSEIKPQPSHRGYMSPVSQGDIESQNIHIVQQWGAAFLAGVL